LIESLVNPGEEAIEDIALHSLESLRFRVDPSVVPDPEVGSESKVPEILGVDILHLSRRKGAEGV
jgi:hypothetical protein